MELENAFSKPGKVMDFRKTDGRGHGTYLLTFSVWSKYFVLFENRKHSLCHYVRAKLCLKMLGFQDFLVMENLNWS